ncbi:endoribonuclease Dicer homolog 2 [Aristolochia californica]|uniref:endoribonuclease Dicer homolog 2 n=1 Tax=Aristolochia californica TaxID=171875 RepID=UPI0035E0B5EC
MEMARNEKVRVDHIAARGLEIEEKDCRKHRKIGSAGELEMMAPAPEPEPEEFARFYQLEALEKAKKENTIVFLETGSGKTLIAIMLLRNYAHQLRKPSEMVAVFLVPTVVLVKQQAEAIETHVDLKVRKLWGDMGTDFWSAKNWEDELREYEVFVMTPAILLRNLQHRFFKLEMINLLIFDECHHAKGNSHYACIMKEFYHKELLTNGTQLPRILGMTASPINSKGLNSQDSYAIYIRQLEILMNSKVYTVANESVLAEFIPFSTPKVILYEDMRLHDISFLVKQLRLLETKHLQKLEKLHLDEGAIEGAKKRVTKLHAAFHYCLTELGIWLTMKAAESLICSEADIFFWEQKKDVLAEKSVRNFSQDVFQAFSQIVASGWCIGEDFKADLERGLMTAKVNCLIQSLMTYRNHADLRCIVFVERVITAIVIQALLSSVPQLRCWATTYMAGNQSRLQCQSRREQMKIVDAFREGAVNLIVATQILEEGLDVKNCNLVIRFDLSTNVCSFIQSRGRARMQHSDYLLLVKSGDSTAFSKIQKYLSSGDMMREESLRQASVPCPLPEGGMNEEDFYCVETTGAKVTLSSSTSLIYFYCSKLPSDRYFKPSPRFVIDKELEMCTLYLPKSCPIPAVKVQGPSKILKKRACLEACRQLHRIGALTNYLLPELEVDEVADTQNIGGRFSDEQDYFPAELVDCWSSFSEQQIYHCYLFCLKQNFDYDIRVGDIFFVVKCQLDDEVMQTEFQLETDRGSVTVSMKHIGTLHLSSDEVMLARRFQITILRLLVDHNLSKLNAALQHEDREGTLAKINYLLLPSTGCSEGVPNIDWECLKSVSFVSGIDSSNCLIRRTYGGSPCSCPGGVAQLVHTYNNVVCRCMLKNSVVLTPHNGFIYSIDDFLDDMDGNSLMKGKQNLTYKEYFQSSHGRLLCHETEPLLGGRHIFPVKNFLHKNSVRKNKESRSSTYELPPELCMIILSPISAITLYSFSFVPSIMHRIKGMLLAVALKRLQMNHYTQNALVPAIKVLEALTTKKCQEAFSLESLEALGDSFLKYAACQQLFRDHKHHHEGLLSAKKDRIVSNYALFKLGCDQRLPGFIQHEYFDPKEWVIPGNTLDFLENDKEVVLSNTTKLYSRGTRQMKIKVVADVVEALLGAYLSTGGELAALMFMDWLGMKISFVNEVPDDLPLLAKPEMYINIQQIESLIKYSFRNTSLLVEAFTHGSYQVSELQGCYQRLEFLGDSVLDYLITKHLYNTYPGLSPGLLTDLRSASVNNEYYAVAAAKAKLNKHILYASSELHKQITSFVNSVEQLTSDCFYGWESDTSLPKALGDIIESLAGAILVDSGFNKEIVWKCIRRLLGQLVTPSTIKYHPVRELEELCRRNTYELNFLRTCENGFAAVTAEVIADGSVYSKTCSGENKKAAKKLAAKALLELLRASYPNL